MKKILIYCFLICVSGSVYSQTITDSLKVAPDTVFTNNISEPVIPFGQPLNDSIAVDTIAVKTDSVFKPDPLKAVWMGAIIPGYGQIINRKYWKLPIVYGGFLGFAYAISWNNSRYTSYKNGYRDISDTDPNTNYHLKILPRGYTMETYPGGISAYQTRLKSGMEQFRRYRDLSILLSVGYYALVLLEAYVDAQLYDFDIAPDLVLNVVPARIELQHNSRSAFGLQCSIRF
ncbi:MAG: DUF5683 domain-containing protein [Paludibacteraceae bacterium]